MAAPVQITFRDIPHSDAVTTHIEKRAAKLETFEENIVRCHVVVEAPHRHPEHNKFVFHVRIDAHVPGKELVVSRTSSTPSDDVYALLDEAFGDVERLLSERQVRDVHYGKTHNKSPHGVVSKVFPERGYGFLEAEEDGHEIYFHEHSVLGARFAKVKVGARVRYAEELGDKGPQASTVELLRA
jgi:ribosomal subunit interface protein